MATQNTPKADVSAFIVRSDDGGVDLGKTTAQFQAQLKGFIDMEKADESVIATAIEKAWKAHPDAKVLPLGGLVHYAMQNLEYAPEEFNDLSERVANFVRRRPAQYKIGKGKGGGVSRVDASSPSTPAGGSIRPKTSANA